MKFLKLYEDYFDFEEDWEEDDSNEFIFDDEYEKFRKMYKWKPSGMNPIMLCNIKNSHIMNIIRYVNRNKSKFRNPEEIIGIMKKEQNYRKRKNKKKKKKPIWDIKGKGTGYG